MTDERKGGVWGDNSRAGQPWTEDEDKQLIALDGIFGHEFIADHDFNREPLEGMERIEWLRANKPEPVAKLHEEMDR